MKRDCWHNWHQLLCENTLLQINYNLLACCWQYRSICTSNTKPQMIKPFERNAWNETGCNSLLVMSSLATPSCYTVTNRSCGGGRVGMTFSVPPADWFQYQPNGFAGAADRHSSLNHIHSGWLRGDHLPPEEASCVMLWNAFSLIMAMFLCSSRAVLKAHDGVPFWAAVPSLFDVGPHLFAMLKRSFASLCLGIGVRLHGHQ